MLTDKVIRSVAKGSQELTPFPIMSTMGAWKSIIINSGAPLDFKASKQDSKPGGGPDQVERRGDLS